MKIIAKCSFGLEEVLANELRALGVSKPEPINRAVMFEGDKEMLYKANYCLRTANRLIVPYARFKIRSADDLYKRVMSVDWENLFSVNETFAIDSTVFSELFNHTQFAAFKTKDAICDRFREKAGDRPNVDTKDPDFRINLHINADDECTISLDSSGKPLFKRGYRDSRSVAPLKEDLAAGVLLLSEWDRKSTLIDLFCGSGTLLIEASFMAMNIYPGAIREKYGFMAWKNYDADLYAKVKADADAQQIELEPDIIGVDIDGRVLGMCKVNLEASGLTDFVELHKSDLKDFDPPEGPGIIVSNPPYGERIGEDVGDLYQSFGDTLKGKYAGWSAWILTSNRDAMKRVGLRPSRKIPMYNGSLECRFIKYEMYRGTKKIHKLRDGGKSQERKSV